MTYTAEELREMAKRGETFRPGHTRGDVATAHADSLERRAEGVTDDVVELACKAGSEFENDCMHAIAWPKGWSAQERDHMRTAMRAALLAVWPVAAEPSQPADSGRGGFKFDDDGIRLALGYSRNYATARPDISPTAREHVMGLCDRLESLLEDRAALAALGQPRAVTNGPTADVIGEWCNLLTHTWMYVQERDTHNAWLGIEQIEKEMRDWQQNLAAPSAKPAEPVAQACAVTAKDVVAALQRDIAEHGVAEIRAAELAILAAPSPVDQPSAAPDGASLIAVERKRQKDVEGWTPEHDAEHDGGEMAVAAACYATPAGYMLRDHTPPLMWPWDESWWKPGDRLRELVKAGALIAAEIDRLAAAASHGEPHS